MEYHAGGQGAGACGKHLRNFRETLIEAFIAPNLRCEAAYSKANFVRFANSCASAGGTKEAMINAALPLQAEKLWRQR